MFAREHDLFIGCAENKTSIFPSLSLKDWIILSRIEK